MRHLEVLRLRCGIQDFWPPGVPLLQLPPPASQASSGGAPRNASPLAGSTSAPHSGPRQPAVAQSQCWPTAGRSPSSRAAGMVTSSQQQQGQGRHQHQQQPQRQRKQQQTQPLVLFGKHLCGAATDFSLRCAQQCLPSGTPQLCCSRAQINLTV